MYCMITISEQFCSVNIYLKRGEIMKLNKQKYALALARACKGFKDIVAAGVPRGTLCRAMNDEDMRPETIGRIAKAIGVDVVEIID